MNIIPVKERGKKIANPLASTSMVKMAYCDTFDVAPKQDTITLTTSGNFESFVFDGVTTTLASAIAIGAGTVDDIKAAIEAVVGVKEYNVYIEVSYAGGDLTIKHTGDLRLASVGVSDVSAGAQQATTLLSTMVSVSVYNFSGVGTIGPLSLGTTDVALANDPYAHTGTPATDNTTAATLQTDIGTALGTLGITTYGTGVTVTNDTANSEYDVEMIVEHLDNGFSVGGTIVYPTESYVGWKA